MKIFLLLWYINDQFSTIIIASYISIDSMLQVSISLWAFLIYEINMLILLYDIFFQNFSFKFLVIPIYLASLGQAYSTAY